MVNDIAVQDFVNAIKEQPTDPNTTYSATVSKIDNEGVVWVNIYGSDKETPTSSTSAEVKKGDNVTVNWRNNKLYIAGNYSNPSAGVTTVNRVEGVANNAQSTANIAYVAATNAVEDAERAASAATSAESSASQAAISASNAETSAGQAATAASNAQASAGTAATAATNAESSASTAATAATNAQTSAGQAAASAQQAATDAASAKASAYNANEYATRALGNLSTVQSVAETLTWVTQHGTMTKTTDTDLDPTHVYFVRDNNGDYVVGSYHYSIVVEPQKSALSTYYELTIDESLNNYVGTHLALTGEGLWLLPATSGTHKVLIATGAGTTYTTAGTYIVDATGGTVASFRADGVTIGEAVNGKSRTQIGSDGMQIYMSVNSADVELANIGYGLGNSDSGIARAPYYTFGRRLSGSAVGNWSNAEGIDSTASGYASHAEGVGTIARGGRSHAEGGDTRYNGEDYLTVAGGAYSHAEGAGTTANDVAAHAEGYVTVANRVAAHAEGYVTVASGFASHAEGNNTEASGDDSHAEGRDTTASGDYSHAEGYGTTASGDFSHAEGRNTTASANWSHAQNFGTIAASNYQTAIGEYNIEDSAGTYAFIIGNGIDDEHRANAFTVARNGNIDAAGDINIASGKHFKINGTNLAASDIGAVPTTRTINGKALSSDITLSASDITGLMDMFYPVGSYYETSDTTFDPNTTWGGVWELDSAGRVTVARDSTQTEFDTIGETGGSKTVTLTAAQSGLPSHTHTQNAHSHTAAGSEYFVANDLATANNANVSLSSSGTVRRVDALNTTSNVWHHDRSTATATATNIANTAANATSAHENMPPYIVVNRWHRTA